MFTAPAKKKPGTSPEQPSAPAKSKRAKEIDYRQELAILWAKIAPLEKNKFIDSQYGARALLREKMLAMHTIALRTVLQRRLTRSPAVLCSVHSPHVPVHRE